MTIATIDLLLGNWGKWAARQKDGGHGFKESWWVKLIDVEDCCAASNPPPIGDFDVLFMDDAIKQLEPRHTKIVTLMYRDRLPGRRVAEEIGIGKSSVFRELDVIHARLAYLLEGAHA